MRKLFSILRSAEERTRGEYALLVTRTLVVATGRVRAGSGLRGERTMDFGFCFVAFASSFGVEERGFERLTVFTVLRGADFAFAFFELLFVIFFAFVFATECLDSGYAILSAIYCWKRSRTPSNGMRWKMGSKNPSTMIFSASACGMPRDFK